MEKAGEAEGAEGQEVVGDHLGEADDVGVGDELQQAVGKAGDEAGAKAVPVADAADEQHGEQGYGAAHGGFKEL